jgi:hypothetical protein
VVQPVDGRLRLPLFVAKGALHPHARGGCTELQVVQEGRPNQGSEPLHQQHQIPQGCTQSLHIESSTDDVQGLGLKLDNVEPDTSPDGLKLRHYTELLNRKSLDRMKVLSMHQRQQHDDIISLFTRRASHFRTPNRHHQERTCLSFVPTGLLRGVGIRMPPMYTPGNPLFASLLRSSLKGTAPSRVLTLPPRKVVPFSFRSMTTGRAMYIRAGWRAFSLFLRMI